jgi:DNA-binding NtrC family response regulator
MRRLYPLCQRLARADIPIVIEGETGTGKELLAESIHEVSARAQEPFVVFDCTAVPPTLMESALFGHERGAFTGATSSRQGVFEQADGGTLLVDEVGELETSLQSKLLRAVERSEVQRVGANRWTKVNVRVIAATRRNLDREVEAGRFREDLFFRLAVGRVELPALRARHGDVELLARHFWLTLGGVPDVQLERFVVRFADHAWPGNVRELANTVARQLALGELADARDMQSDSSADFIQAVLARNLPLPRAREQVVAEFERRYVERVLSLHGGHVGRAAAASGIARRYFEIVRARSKRSR